MSLDCAVLSDVLLHAENNTEIIVHCFFFKPARVATFHGWCIKIKITQVTLHLKKILVLPIHRAIGQTYDK